MNEGVTGIPRLVPSLHDGIRRRKAGGRPCLIVNWADFVLFIDYNRFQRINYI